ncbi:MAG: cysteine--tRNA ligase [Phycisphaerae bacterium]|nr:cysteine--tRNA ligase [Phycisphaerae bacterium]
MPLRLYNTRTRRAEELRPIDPGLVTYYSCGPTVYDDAHIGNFRAFLAGDLLRRWLESPLCEVSDGRGGVHRGPRRVVQVMNITDVGHMTDDAEGGESGEDRMAVAGRRLEEAKKAGTIPAGVDVDAGNPYAIARFYESRFREDARRLGLKVALDADRDPTLMPRATENVPGMIAVVRRLLASGHAYVAGEPGRRAVYFRVRSFGPYGRLSGNTLDRLREGEGGRIQASHQSQKEHPADFLLWKEDPTHLMSWEAAFDASPWGRGYPGWHVECTVMSVARLARGALDGEPLTPEQLASLVVENGAPLIDLHSGGEDNIFPHHECEIAQSCCAFNADPDAGSFAGLWLHARFLLVNGEKMSKSKGNFFTARDLFARGVEPAALRLELIKTHYRANANFTDQGLVDSQRLVERWRRVLAAGGGPEAEGGGVSPVEREFADAMNDDLNIARGIAAVNTWAGGLASPGPEDARVMRRLDGVLGVLGLERPEARSTAIGVYQAGVEPSAQIEALLEERRAARAARDFATSDRIRDRLASMGLAVKDTPGGLVEVSRRP